MAVGEFSSLCACHREASGLTAGTSRASCFYDESGERVCGSAGACSCLASGLLLNLKSDFEPDFEPYNSIIGYRPAGAYSTTVFGNQAHDSWVTVGASWTRGLAVHPVGTS